MTWLTERCTTVSGLVGYVWELECGEDHRYHIHAVFYLNGHTGRSDASESPYSPCGMASRTEKSMRV